MKKNKMMRLASLLLIAVLLTTSVIGGTFAKYVTTAEGSDSARVAYWGFGQAGANDLVIDDLFAATYSDDVVSKGGDVIAPGTAGSANFAFKYTNNSSELNSTAIEAPEVDYTFEVAVTENCDALIQGNKNIQWKLDNGSWGTWTKMIQDIDALGTGSANGKYEAGNLPAGFDTDDTHTISWQWLIEGTETYTVDGVTLTQDEYDTHMGNQADLDDVSIEITITATQVNN